jgi:hypothetical protein
VKALWTGILKPGKLLFTGSHIGSYRRKEIVMIKHFKEVNGLYIDKIYGQERLAFAHTDVSDLYDLVEWAEQGGYPGSVIKFYDLKTGDVYTPFQKKKDVMYGNPVYLKRYYYFLQADNNAGIVTIYKYLPGEEPESVAEFNIQEVNLYNLMIVGEDVHLISQDNNVFNCYYPEKFSFKLQPNESVSVISDGKVYLEAWIEEGWDDENDRASEDYKYYDKVIVKDFEGNTLSEEVGSIYQAPDGIYWIA